MATPPRPTRQQYDEALARIHARRRNAGDDHPLALSEDPREVLAYLRKRGSKGLVADDTGDDITDALTLRLWLWWEGEATELWLLEAAEKLGRERRPIAKALGRAAGQSIIDRITRTRRLLGREKITTTPVAKTSRDDQIRAVAASLIQHRADMPADIGDDLYADQVADALPHWQPGRPAPTEGVLNALRFLIGDLLEHTQPGTVLRELADRGAELVGVRSTGT